MYVFRQYKKFLLNDVLHSVHSSLEIYFMLLTTRQAVILATNLQK